MPRMLGRHLIVELFDCDTTRLDDSDFLRAQCEAAAVAMGATVVGMHAHRFEPVGVSVVVVLAESHLALHTWPEQATASLDIFTCSPRTDPHRAKSHLVARLLAGRTAEMELQRGDLNCEPSPGWRPSELTTTA